MNKFPASVVKGAGFSLSRREGHPHYNIAKTGELSGKQSANVGFLYKNATDGKYVVRIGLNRNVVADFNAAKSFIKVALAA